MLAVALLLLVPQTPVTSRDRQAAAKTSIAARLSISFALGKRPAYSPSATLAGRPVPAVRRRLSHTGLDGTCRPQQVVSRRPRPALAL